MNKNHHYEKLKLKDNNNKSIQKRQNLSLNNDKYNKTMNISNLNNSINLINNYHKIPVSKKSEKMPNKLVFSNPNIV